MTNSRKACTSGQKCQPATAREAWHCQLMHHPTVRIEEIAEDSEVAMRADTLMHMVNPDRQDSWLPSRKTERLLQLTPGHDVVLRYHASRSHGVFFRVPQDAVDRTTADAVREFGELLIEQSKAISDGVVSSAEAVRIEREAYEAIAAIVGMVEDAKRRMAAAPAGAATHAGPRAVAGGRR